MSVRIYRSRAGAGWRDPRLSFLGGAGTVTGSKYLVEHENHKVLVDCGLFQGFKALRLKNWAPFPIEPRRIDAVVLTHAHLDHSGYLPLLVKRGFRGPVYCSRPRSSCARSCCPTPGILQEKDAEFANRHGFSKHKPALPLYTAEDAQAALEHLTADAVRSGPGAAARRHGSAAARRAHPRRGIGPTRLGGHHDRLLRRPRPLRRSDHGRSGIDRARRLSLGRIHLWQPASRRARSGGGPGRDRRDHDRAAAERSSFRPLRWDGHKACSFTSTS